MRYLLIILILLTSCKSTKDVNKLQANKELKETIKTTTTRIGDTVRYEVPKVVLKDTVITIKNYKTGTTQILRYNDEGRLSSAECLSGVIQIIEENNRILIENINSMQKHKETEISSSVILYFFLGLAVFLCIVFIVFFYVMKKYIKTIIPV